MPNVTTEAALSPEIKKYYDRKLLEKAVTNFVYANYGQKRSMPKNNGHTVEFRKFNLLKPSLTATTDTVNYGTQKPDGTFDQKSVAVPGQKLSEGVVPDGQNLSVTAIEATVESFGAYVKTTDWLNLISYDNVISEATELLGDQMGRLLEWYTRDIMIAGASALPAAGTNLTVNDVRKAARELKKAKARSFSRAGAGGHFICIVDPDVSYDLMSDPNWLNVRQYQDKEAIYRGELGKMFGVVFVESTEGLVNTSHHSLVFGADAYGTVDIAGQGNMQTIVKPVGSAGTADPLNQFSTVGVKVQAYTAKVLNPDWIIDITSGATA